MTEKQLDDLRFKLGGDWYDNWWYSSFSWFALHEGGKSRWWYNKYHKKFFNGINKGWLEMYPPKKMTQEIITWI